MVESQHGDGRMAITSTYLILPRIDFTLYRPRSATSFVGFPIEWFPGGRVIRSSKNSQAINMSGVSDGAGEFSIY